MKIQVVGQLDKDFVRKQEEFINNLSQQHLKTVATTTEKVIQDNIDAGKKRPSGSSQLSKAFFAEKIDDKSWGVGKIAFLNQVAKYWQVINFGSTHMVGRHLPKGVFNPGEPAPNSAFFRTGRFEKGANYNGEQYSPIVTKPIPPSNYIERTIAQMQVNIQNIIKGIR